jgi:hypothetical protein
LLCISVLLRTARQLFQPIGGVRAHSQKEGADLEWALGSAAKTALVEAPIGFDTSVAIGARDFIDDTDGRF